MRPHKKEDYLIKKIVPFDIKKTKIVDDLLKNLRFCGFQGRNLAIGLDILEKMVSNPNCFKVLTLAGAMVPAGMGEIICAMIEHKIIDAIVSTGANITHDLVDAVTNIGHYVGSSKVNDEELFNFRINRIYDVFLPEENYQATENMLLTIIKDTFNDKEISCPPSIFLKKIGEKIKNRCILSLASKYNVPIFVPAFSDSELALDLLVYSIKEGYKFNFDILEDIKIFAELIKKADKAGTIIIGGGVPRNWAQQVYPLLDQMEKMETIGYNYSVRIHTATEYDGGLSGCTISESKSWGKYSLDADHVSIWCDATIALPILITGLFQRLNIV